MKKKSFALTFPHLIKEWDYEKNGDLSPYDVPPKGRKIVWWKCIKGHSYEARLADKANGKACPECSILNRSIAVRKPEALKYWDYEKNTEAPERVSYGSNREYFWKCDKGHSFKNPVKAMTRKGGGGCPYCRGLRVNTSNSLATLFPKVAEEWIVCTDDPSLTPETIATGSHKKVKWKCKKGHKWQTTPKNRTKGKTGCPNCKKGRKISKQTYTLFYYLKQEFDDTIPEFPLKGSRMSIDLYVPSKKVAIEYDGGLYHKNTTRDIKKDTWLLEKMPNVTLIRIREPDCGRYSSPNPKVIKYQLDDQQPKTFERCIKQLFGDIFQLNKTINLEKDNIDILALMDITETKNSLGKLFPDISKEWDTAKNKGLSPYQFKPSSHEKMFWKCKVNHSWEATIASRTHSGNNCPFCGSRKISSDNNLAVKYPNVVKEWHPTRNKRKPEEYFPYSHYSVWWLCMDCKHEWTAFIYNRTLNNSGCPKCSRKKRT